MISPYGRWGFRRRRVKDQSAPRKLRANPGFAKNARDRSTKCRVSVRSGGRRVILTCSQGSLNTRLIRNGFFWHDEA